MASERVSVECLHAGLGSEQHSLDGGPSERVRVLHCYRIGFWSVGLTAWLSAAETHAEGGHDTERDELKGRTDPFNVFNNAGTFFRTAEELRMPSVPQIFSILLAPEESE